MNLYQDYYVYVYTDPRKIGDFSYGEYRFINVPFYVGKGRKKRCFEHLYKRKQDTDPNKHKTNRIRLLQKSYDLKNFLVFIKKNLTEKDSYILEKDIIKNIGRYNIGTGPLLNVSEGGDGWNRGIKPNASAYRKYKPLTEEQKKNLSEKLRGRKFSSETLLKMSAAQSGANNAMYGKITPDSVKEKISKSLKGRKHSQETIEKIRISNTGHKVSPETIQKIKEHHPHLRGEKNPNVRTYKIISPTCEVFIHSKGLSAFTLQHQLNLKSFYASICNKKPYKGWVAERIK